jgi:hypothetical protein
MARSGQRFDTCPFTLTRYGEIRAPSEVSFDMFNASPMSDKEVIENAGQSTQGAGQAADNARGQANPDARENCRDGSGRA